LIVYVDDLSQTKPRNLGGFFTGWKNPPSKEKLLEILRNSDYVVLAVDNETGNVIGFINALSDKVLYAYIPMLEVLPAHQGQGIGTKLVNLMLEKLKNFYAVDLCCDEEIESFYQHFDFHKVSGMIKRNYKNLK